MTENVRPTARTSTWARVLGRLTLTLVVVAACARTPTGPSVLVLAGSGKTLEEFQRDDAACRASAARELETTKGGEVPAQRRYDMTYMQCMYAKGHQIPVPGGRPGYTSSGSPRPVPETPGRR